MNEHIQPIIETLSELIKILEAERNSIGMAYNEMRDKSEEVDERYLSQLTENKEKIHYLLELRDALDQSESEESLAKNLDKVANIGIVEVKKFRGFLKGSGLGFPAVFKRKQPAITINVPSDQYKEVSRVIKKIPGDHKKILEALREQKSDMVRDIIGFPDENGQIRSPGIEVFIRETAASSHEKISKDQPPALNDFRRDDFVNGVRLPVESTENGVALKQSLMDFLSKSGSIVDDLSREALCNAMLKTGQTLNTVFVNDLGGEQSALRTLQKEPLAYSQGLSTFNWTLNPEGKLSVDVRLDVKSVTKCLVSPEPLVADSTTGKLREYNPKGRHNPEGDEYAKCPTLASFKATITFETQEVKPKDVSEKEKKVMAIPTVSHFEAKILSNQVQYAPPLTDYIESEFLKEELAESLKGSR